MHGETYRRCRDPPDAAYQHTLLQYGTLFQDWGAQRR
jgi:hypothetical protein